MRLPSSNIRTLGKTAVGATALGVGAAYLTGVLPGTEGIPGAIADAFSGFTDGIGNVFTGATDGLAGIFQMGPLLVLGGGALVVLFLLK